MTIAEFIQKELGVEESTLVANLLYLKGRVISTYTENTDVACREGRITVIDKEKQCVFLRFGDSYIEMGDDRIEEEAVDGMWFDFKDVEIEKDQENVTAQFTRHE